MREFDRESGGLSALSLAERLGRRRFMGKLAMGAMGLATALAGLPQTAEATVSVLCCSLCRSSTTCSGVCCWSWVCCGAPGTRAIRCKECYNSSSACTGTCNTHIVCSQASATQAIC